MFLLYALSLLWTFSSSVNCRRLLLLYRPRDISTDCAVSEHLRYDLSFGMGMSDTITLVFRTMTEIDYECLVEIVTDIGVPLLIVIRFPNKIGYNCFFNPNSFTVFKKNICFSLCNEVRNRELNSPYFSASVTGRFRFRFVSNSSVNTDIHAYQYEVTATAARVADSGSCNKINETICVMGRQTFCFTSGVVCDGIKNCGVPQWFDERTSDCEMRVERLGYTPVIAIAAVLLFALLAGTQVLKKCLPPPTSSFFIFNTNEDNRLCIVPAFKSPDASSSAIEMMKRVSIIPVSSSSESSDNEVGEIERDVKSEEIQSPTTNLPAISSNAVEVTRSKATVTIKSISTRLQERFRFVSGRARFLPTVKSKTDILTSK